MTLQLMVEYKQYVQIATQQLENVAKAADYRLQDALDQLTFIVEYMESNQNSAFDDNGKVSTLSVTRSCAAIEKNQRNSSLDPQTLDGAFCQLVCALLKAVLASYAQEEHEERSADVSDVSDQLMADRFAPLRQARKEKLRLQKILFVLSVVLFYMVCGIVA